MVTNHKQTQAIGLEEEENNPARARGAKLKSITAQAAQSEPGMEMRTAKRALQFGEPGDDFILFACGNPLGPALPSNPVLD